MNVDLKSIYQVALGKDRCPYAWQETLATGSWPKVLIAPTGYGKTAGVTLGWAVHRMRAPGETPRRLIWCLPMRTLVEQIGEQIEGWFENLAKAGVDESNVLPHPEDIHKLMGGIKNKNWYENPERPAIIIGTQDMLISRALMRGYAASRPNWPIEFALLHNDAQWIFDEVQLMGSGRATSAQLEAFRQKEAKDREGSSWGKPSRSLWISATLDPNWLKTVDHTAPNSSDVLRLDPRKEPDSRLHDLANAKKTLTHEHISLEKNKLSAYTGELASSILRKHRTGHMTLVIVNRVARAQQLYIDLGIELKKRKDPAPQLALVHARFRSSDRKAQMNKVVGYPNNGCSGDLIVVATQAIEAGVDISAAVLFTEIAPWASMVQRFGRANRYAELSAGACVRWIDFLPSNLDDKDAQDLAKELALPYTVEELTVAKSHLRGLCDAAAINLRSPDRVDPPRHVIRRKDLDDMFDTDPDLTGFDLDISPYVRDADDTDIRVFWRDCSEACSNPPKPREEELCAVPIGEAKKWFKENRSNKLFFVRDPQWKSRDREIERAPLGWERFLGDPWPGMTVLVDTQVGGYDEEIGFTGNPKKIPKMILALDPQEAENQPAGEEADGHGEDPLSGGVRSTITLSAHLDHVAQEAMALCDALEIDPDLRCAIIRAAHWHDLGKAHKVFQKTMRKGLNQEVADDVLLAKTTKNLRHDRSYFRHEVASMLAFLSHEKWSRDADLIAYLIAAHHGKVRMNLRPLPREQAPNEGEHTARRFVRGVWEEDQLQALDLNNGERWEGGTLTLLIMELGKDDITQESWAERTRHLLARFGPFELAWMETLLRLADWRASRKEAGKLC